MSDEKSAEAEETAPIEHTGGADDPLQDAERVVAAFGGIRPMATQLGIAATTIQGWKSRGHIPEGRRQSVLDAAAAVGIDLTAVPPAEEPEEIEATEEEAGAPADEPQPTAQPARAASGGNGVAWLAVVLAGAALAAVLTEPKWEPILYGRQSAAASADIQTLKSRVAALEKRRPAADISDRLAAVEQGLSDLRARASAAAAPDSGPRLAALSSRIDSLASDLDKASARVSTARADVSAELDTLREAVSALREKVEQAVVDTAASTARKSAALVAVGALEVALNDGAPYAPALDAVKKAAPDHPEVVAATGSLAAHADTGIPTRAQLARRLDAIAANRGTPLWQANGDSWTDKVLRKIASVVSIRKLNKADLESGSLDRAKRALADKDLPGAIAVLDGATGDAAQWVSDARARMAADKALNKLRLWAIASLDTSTTTK